MRQVTATEKYRAVNEGKMAKKEFVRQMKQAFPQFLSTYDGFDSSVQILKNRGLLFETPAINNIKEAHDHQTAKESKYSLDALDRGIRAELGAMGLTTFGGPITADQFFKAEAKAKAALDKDPNHYLNLMSGESSKVDKHDREKEVKRGALDKDTFNDMKKATLKEEVEVQVEEFEMSEDAKKNLLGKVVGALRAKYPDVTAGILKDFIKTHYQDLLDGADIESEFEEYISVNYEGPSDMREKQGKDHDGDGDIDSDDYMMAKDKAIKKAMGKNVDENQGDYVSFAMQNIGDENTPVILTHGFNRYDEKKYKTTLGKALAFIKKNADASAIENGDVTVDGGRGVARITIGDQEFDIEAMGKEVKEIAQDSNFQILKKGPYYRYLPTDDLTTDLSDIGSHGRQRSKDNIAVIKTAEELLGILHDMHMEDPERAIAFADQNDDIIQFLGKNESYAMKRMQQAHTQDRLAGKKSTYDQAKEKQKDQEKQLKEAIKSLIKKTLNEDVINEAATSRLSQKMEEFGGYNGAQGVINSLENIVTEVEAFYGKVREKIQKVYDDMGNIENEEGLKIGQFIGPAIESAFMQDLRPVTKKGFTQDLQLPKAKQIDPEVLAQARAAGEVDEAPEEPKSTVFTPNF